MRWARYDQETFKKKQWVTTSYVRGGVAPCVAWIKTGKYCIIYHNISSRQFVLRCNWITQSVVPCLESNIFNELLKSWKLKLDIRWLLFMEKDVKIGFYALCIIPTTVPHLFMVHEFDSSCFNPLIVGSCVLTVMDTHYEHWVLEMCLAAGRSLFTWF